jgi:1,4-dihydroxy-2-naphthoate octaprenyltransferase
MSTKFSAWLHAFRLRTLPLALSSIITGSFAAYSKSFNGFVFGLAILTTLLLQILSNLANDFGDSEKGTDNDDRIGPKRAIQAGLLSFSEMKTAIIVNVMLCLVAGIALIYLALGIKPITLFFFILGLAAIAAAIKYTVGKGAYGYSGLGDVFVFLFFGVVGVNGSYYLQTQQFNPFVFFLGITIGCFSVGVLNLNNMRDRESDAKANKNTLVVKIGLRFAKYYQSALILFGLGAAIYYLYYNATAWIAYLPVLVFPVFLLLNTQIAKVENPKDFDPFLKKLALSTFAFSIFFALGQLFL